MSSAVPFTANYKLDHAHYRWLGGVDGVLVLVTRNICHSFGLYRGLCGATDMIVCLIKSRGEYYHHLFHPIAAADYCLLLLRGYQ